MRVRIVVESEDLKMKAQCVVDKMLLDSIAGREHAKVALWHAFEAAKKRLKEKTSPAAWHEIAIKTGLAK